MKAIDTVICASTSVISEGSKEYFFNPIGPEKKIEETWEWKVLQIWKTFPQTPLYADISYFNEILPLKIRDGSEGQRCVSGNTKAGHRILA